MGATRRESRRRRALYNGCPVFTEMAVPDALLTPEIIDFCFEKFQDMHPLQQWVAKMLQAVR
ncbi:MAG: hypothetical protein DWQ10_08385 [Calditrichaeota bacterium]|nr:MAG: hypothetical protein DWQ10_08385 [Calditrichota bacterium]